MFVDQSAIDELLAQATAGVDLDAAHAPPRAPERACGGSARGAAASRPIAASVGASPVSGKLARILRIRVPLIAELARRKVAISVIRSLTNGSIIEFERPVDSPVTLLINNHAIGEGIAVRIDEMFGLRITEIGGTRERITSMGGR